MKKIHNLILGVLSILLLSGNIYAKDLNITSNFDYSIEMFNTTYYISYDLDGGVLYKINTYTPEADDFEIGIPTKEGYAFLGWTGSNGHIPNPKVAIKQGTVMNLTFKANWKKLDYKINYDLDGGTISNPLFYDNETEQIILGEPIKDGFTFIGWTGSNGNIPNKNVIISKSNKSNLNYKANWSMNNFNINYNLNDENYTNASQSNPKTNYTINDNDFTLTNPTRTAYNFLGWIGTNGKTNSMNVKITKGSIGDRWYKAQWSPIDYNINYNYNGGSAENPSNYNIETPSFILNNPTKRGYNFDGWTGTDLSSKTQNVTINNGSYGNRSFTSHWSIITYYINYDYNGGTIDSTNPSEYNVETPTFTLNNPTKACHTFTGYTGTDLSSANTNVSIAQGSIGDRSYIANWSKITYSANANISIDGAGPKDGNTSNFVFDVYRNGTLIQSNVNSWSGTPDCGDSIRVVAKDTRTGYTVYSNGDETKTMDGDKTFSPTWRDTTAPTITNFTLEDKGFMSSSDPDKKVLATATVIDNGSGVKKMTMKLGRQSGATSNWGYGWEGEVYFESDTLMSDLFTEVSTGNRSFCLNVWDYNDNHTEVCKEMYLAPR